MISDSMIKMIVKTILDSSDLDLNAIVAKVQTNIETAVANVKSVDDRLARIEQHLGIVSRETIEGESINDE